MFGAKTGEIYIQLGPVMVGVIGWISCYNKKKSPYLNVLTHQTYSRQKKSDGVLFM